ncbi:molybdopterin-dependent oxidoreductase [Acuticoccus sp. MNP-M23]|uniref:molybdopterin-dependent oxidoreductase n=1 Tax=Acuticoccus sp. MNP-M23 TaxID=3072793 RepID=UPI0028162901|nr:molybdopterin-dependent oxidoreductase [Acuticoccus sp. MNP-M23]WMS43934.1 molybdopterin-dependent oxidoreductase [Acuticoccus sp. MNP-M23]
MSDTLSDKRPIVAAHWGTYRAEMKDGRAVALHPFEADPDPSGIGGAMLETLADPTRIGQPMVRRGWLAGEADRSLRGRDEFVAVPWDEALDLAGGALSDARAAHGNEAIYAGSYGWASAGRFHHAQSQLRRFMGLFGGYTSRRNSYSFAAAEVVLPHVMGSMHKLLQEHTGWDEVGKAGALVVAFGGIALRNAQVNGGGVARHTQRGDMAAALAAGARIVNINPSALDLSPDVAEWMPIRPCTDTALMLGLAHTLLTEKLCDHAFLASHCEGFELFAPYLTGTADGTPKDAAWAAAITGLAPDAITALARRMAAGPTLVNFSWSLTRQENGESAVWMAVVLAAMLGRIGKPGEGLALGLGAINSVGATRGPLPVAAFPGVPNKVQRFIPVARIADMLLAPGDTVDYDGQTLTYPDIRLIYWAGGNPFHHHQDLNRLRTAWQKAETVIVHEPHWTPLARFADIVFPATLSAERDDVSASSTDTHLFATRAVARPFGESRSDHAIFAGLAERLTPPGGNGTLADAFTEGRDEAGWIEEIYARTAAAMAKIGQPLPDYETFRTRGFVAAATAPQPSFVERFSADPAAAPLPTPSGRIEIYSAAIASFGHPGLPGHPAWHAPAEWLGAEGAMGQLHLVTHQPARRLHSQLDQSAYSRAGKIAGRTPCVLHPAEADRHGIKAGDLVEVFNARGRTIAAAALDENVIEGVLLMATGAWYDPDWDGDPALCKHGNPNVLTADTGTTPLAQGPSALSCLVRIRRWEGPVPPVTAFVPPRIVPRAWP